MIKKYLTTFIFTVGMCVSTVGFSNEKAHWSYSGDEGPEHWGELDPEFSTCTTGRNQSPINLTNMIDARLAPVGFRYLTGGHEVINNGHTIQVNYAPGSIINIDNHLYELKQFHFHSPSENIIEGRSFPMEAHFVHTDKEGNLAVIAVMFVEGAFNPELAKAWASMPESAGGKAVLTAQVDANRLLPRRSRWGHRYFHYNGSLTTPPCSEGVTWIVMKGVNVASREQIEHFRKVLGHPNNRPLQPVNARLIAR